MSWPSPPLTSGSNLTLTCYDDHNHTVNTHTLMGAAMDSQEAATAVRLSVDAPSVSTGTGEAVVMDGHDVALIRAEVVDRNGE